jgi:hypothetical protein
MKLVVNSCVFKNQSECLKGWRDMYILPGIHQLQQNWFKQEVEEYILILFINLVQSKEELPQQWTESGIVPVTGTVKNVCSNYQFWHTWCYRILIIKPTRCTNSQIYLWNRTLHVSGGFSVYHQESSTVHAAIGICHTGLADCLVAGSGWNAVPSWSCYQAVTITCMYCWVYSVIRLPMMHREPVRNT